MLIVDQKIWDSKSIFAYLPLGILHVMTFSGQEGWRAKHVLRCQGFAPADIYTTLLKAALFPSIEADVSKPHHLDKSSCGLCSKMAPGGRNVSVRCNS